MDDIGHHAEHHLRRRLAADAAADTTGGREEIGVLALPALGDRIAHEDDPHRFARRLERRILGGIFAEPGEILAQLRSEEHTSELQSLMRISYAVFCLKKQ